MIANPYTPAVLGSAPSAANSPPPADSVYRFWTKPWPSKTATDQTNLGTTMQQEVARTTPVFSRGCSQFIVEYAGDYLTQQTATGKATPIGSLVDVGEDGQIDFDAIPHPLVWSDAQPGWRRDG
jgi:hypothetical protein